MKTKSCLIILLFLFINLSKAQEVKEKIHIGFSFQPHYYTTVGVYTKMDASGDNAIKASGKKPSFSANVFITKKRTKRKTFGIGVGYQYGARKTNKTAFSRRLRAPNSTYSHFKLSSYHHNIEIPLNINYSLGKRMYLSYGLSGIINLANINHWVLYKKDGTAENKYQKMEDNDSYTKYKKGNLALNVGLGYDMVDTKKVIFSVKPTLQVSLFNQTKHYNVGLHKSVYAGLNLIVVFK